MIVMQVPIVRIRGVRSSVNVHRDCEIRGRIKFKGLAVNVFHARIRTATIAALVNTMTAAHNWCAFVRTVTMAVNVKSMAIFYSYQLVHQLLPF